MWAQHSRDREPGMRKVTGPVVLTPVKLGIGLDRVSAYDVEGEGLCGESRGRGDDDARLDAFWVTRRPAKGLMPPERTPYDGSQTRDGEEVDQAPLHVHHVFDRDEREVASVRDPARRIHCAGARGAAAAPEYVGANHEETSGIDWAARTDEGLPPSRVVAWLVPRHMRVARDRVTDQDRVAAVCVE